jgi:hypothetical protein
MIVLLELDNLDSSLKFIKADGAVDNKNKIMFLMRTNYKEAESLKVKICSKYHAPDIPNYLEAGKYLELKYRLCSNELCMEIYLDLLYDLCRPGNNFLGVYTRSKCLVAAKVSQLYSMYL